MGDSGNWGGQRHWGRRGGQRRGWTAAMGEEGSGKKVGVEGGGGGNFLIIGGEICYLAHGTCSSIAHPFPSGLPMVD